MKHLTATLLVLVLVYCILSFDSIQPESEDPADGELCDDEDEEDCKTDLPPSPSPSLAELVQTSSEEGEEEEPTTQPPLSSSTTSKRPALVTSTSFPSTTPTPQILQFPSSSPETLAALLALHKAFTQSLQQHSSKKNAQVNPPNLAGFIESIEPVRETPHVHPFELDSAPSPAPTRLPTQFPSKQPQTQFSVPQKPLFQNPPKLQFQSPPPPISKQEFSSQASPHFQNTQNTQYRPRSKSAPPLTLPPVSLPKSIKTAPDSYRNNAFHHSFHISNQGDHYPDPNYQDHYLDQDTQSSPQPKTEAPKQYDFDYEEDEDYYDEKPPSSTITPYQLHQLKVSQVKSANQAKALSSSGAHNSFVREVSSPTPTKPFSIPTYRSVTPSIAIITTTSTTSSSSFKTSKPVQSAILTSKENPTAAGFITPLKQPTTNRTLQNRYPEPPQSYDDYREGDVRSDPFYKDVPKIGRSKRGAENNLFGDSSMTFLDYSSLMKLKHNLLNNVFKNNTQTILHAILKQYCYNKNDTRISSAAYCLFVRGRNFSDTELGDNWKVIVPKGDKDYFYLSKTFVSSNESESSIINILIIVHFPDEFKVIRDSILRTFEHNSSDKIKQLNFDNVNSLFNHSFKRVDKKNIVDSSLSRKSLKNSSKTIKEQKKKRKKRQSGLSESDEIVHTQQENLRLRPRTRAGQVLVRRRPTQIDKNADISEVPRTQTRKRLQRLPIKSQPQIQLNMETTPQYAVEGERSPFIPANATTVSNDRSSMSVSTSSSDRDKQLGRPTSRRRGQGVRYHWSEPSQPEQSQRVSDSDSGKEDTSTVYPFNLKPGTQFTCNDKIKGGYYADVEAECYGYFICSQGEINGP